MKSRRISISRATRPLSPVKFTPLITHIECMMLFVKLKMGMLRWGWLWCCRRVSGLGKECAKTLAKRGAHVVLASRRVSVLQDVKASIIAEAPAARVDVMPIDLTSLKSVTQFAEDYKKKNLPLNILMYAYPSPSLHSRTEWVVLLKGPFPAVQAFKNVVFCVCDVATMEVFSPRSLPPTRMVSRLCGPLTFWVRACLQATFSYVKKCCILVLVFDGVCVCNAGHYALTKMLMDKLKETAAESGIEGRIMFTGSDAHRISYQGGINFDALTDPSL